MRVLVVPPDPAQPGLVYPANAGFLTDVDAEQPLARRRSPREPAADARRREAALPARARGGRLPLRGARPALPHGGRGRLLPGRRALPAHARPDRAPALRARVGLAAVEARLRLPHRRARRAAARALIGAARRCCGSSSCRRPTTTATPRCAPSARAARTCSRAAPRSRPARGSGSRPPSRARCIALSDEDAARYAANSFTLTQGGASHLVMPGGVSERSKPRCASAASLPVVVDVSEFLRRAAAA